MCLGTILIIHFESKMAFVTRAAADSTVKTEKKNDHVGLPPYHVRNNEDKRPTAKITQGKDYYQN